MKKHILPLLSSLLLVSCTDHRDRATAEASAIATALEAHHVEYGAFPRDNNAAATAAILGGNPRGINFMIASPYMLNSARELVDPWGTPYHLSLPPDLSVTVFSAGPDRTFGTPDDITWHRKRRKTGSP